MNCNFSANITVGKHLISNAFLDFHWAFRPLVASVLGLDGQLWTSISFTFFLVARNPLSPATRSYVGEPLTPETPTAPEGI